MRILFRFAIAFIFVSNRAGYLRWTPLALLLTYWLLLVVPEAGLSDFRWQWPEQWWRGPVVVILYSLSYFVLTGWLLKSKSMFQYFFAFVTFMTGMSFLALGILLGRHFWYLYYVVMPNY